MALHAFKHGRRLLQHFLRIDLQRHINGNDIGIRRAEQPFRHLHHGTGRVLAMRSHQNDDFFFQFIILSRLQQQGNILNFRPRHRHMVVLFNQHADFLCHAHIVRVLGNSPLDFRIRNGFMRLDPLQKSRQMQAERIKESITIAAIQSFLHIQGNLLGKIHQSFIDDFQESFPRGHIDRMLLII